MALKAVERCVLRIRVDETDLRVRGVFKTENFAHEVHALKLAGWVDPQVEAKEHDAVQELWILQAAGEKDVRARADLVQQITQKATRTDPALAVVQMKVRMQQMEHKIDKLGIGGASTAAWEDEEGAVKDSLVQRFKELDELRETIEKEQDPGRKQELTITCRRKQLAINQQVCLLHAISFVSCPTLTDGHAGSQLHPLCD